MTENLTQDRKTLLGQADPNRLADLFREGQLDLGQLLEDLSGTTSEALTVDSSRQATLTKTPIGPVVAAYTEGANHTPLVQMPEGETLAAGEFSIDYATREITCGATVSDTEEITVIYLGITAGTSASDLSEKLDGLFER